jgi:cephalosporin-C deacetylase
MKKRTIEHIWGTTRESLIYIFFFLTTTLQLILFFRFLHSFDLFEDIEIHLKNIRMDCQNEDNQNFQVQFIFFHLLPFTFYLYNIIVYKKKETYSMLHQDALSQFSAYKGSAQKPADFDQFWDAQISSVQQLGTDYTLDKVAIPSKAADFYHLYFTGVGNARIHAQLVRPRDAAKGSPAILLFHGYHCDAGDFADKVSLAAEGFTVLALDARGQGGLSENNTSTKGGSLNGLIIRGIEEGKHNLCFKNVFSDCLQLARIAFSMEGIDENNVSVMGASQGGALAVACAALEPRISKALVQYPFLSDYRKAFTLNAAASAYAELVYHFRYRDPRHLHESEFFDTLEYIDIQNLAPRIKARVVWGIGLEDVVCPPQTQFAVFNKLISKKVMLPYPEYGHEALPGYSDATRSFLLENDDGIFS